MFRLPARTRMVAPLPVIPTGYRRPATVYDWALQVPTYRKGTSLSIQSVHKGRGITFRYRSVQEMSTGSPTTQNGSRRSGAVKRIMQELKELQENVSNDFKAYPLESNLFEWHFTIRGPADSEFQGGVYHGRIMLPSGYPFQPPDLMLLTPSGRFEIGKKICLSISGYHPEYWQPSWSIRTVLVALIAFMPTDPQGAIGSLNYSADERRVLARESVSWSCPSCGLSNATCFDSLQPALELPDSNRTVSVEDIPSSPVNNQGQQEETVEERLASDVAEIKTKSKLNTSSADLFWTSLIVALFTAILAILIKKAITT